MPNLIAFLAPVALLLPDAPSDATASEGHRIGVDPAFGAKAQTDHTVSSRDYFPPSLDAPYATPVQHQVRIQERVIIRVAPRRMTARQNLMADLSRPRTPRRFEERKMEKCVPVADVAGVQTGSGNRLILFLNDRRIITANLEKSCRARDFYSGFYVEKNEDGKICVERDKLQSRSGANCEVARMRQLVPVSE